MRSDTIKIIVTAICLLAAACGSRNESASTPASKPEVWGTVLPALPGSPFDANVYETPMGDVVLLYAAYKVVGSRFQMKLSFFNFSELIPLSSFEEIVGGEIDRTKVFSRAYFYARYLGFRRIDRSDHGLRPPASASAYRDKLGYAYLSVSVDRWNCPPYQGHIERIDAHGRSVQKVAFVRVTQLPRLDYRCASGHRYTDLHRVSAPVLDLYPLRDGTFLLLGFNGPLAVRLRSDLTSPYIDESDELLALDADVFSSWVNDCDREAEQLEVLYSDPASIYGTNLAQPAVIYRSLPYFSTVDACLSVRLAREIGAKNARAQAANPPRP